MQRMKTALPIIVLVILALPQVYSEDEVGYRLTVQIHEAPGFNTYYLFYFHQIEFTKNETERENRSVTITMALTGGDPQGLSAYPSNESYFLDFGQDASGSDLRITATTDAPSLQVRYYIEVRAREVGSNRDHLLTFPEPSIDRTLKSLTISINWPNWNFEIKEMEPEGAEMVMNPMFETDPYKAVSYYWYYPRSQANSRQPAEISVTLRSAQTSQRVTRNQSIMIILAVICVPTAIFIAFHPPKKLETPERKFKITEGKPKREIKRGRYKVK